VESGHLAPDAADHDGRTALHCAIDLGNEDAARALVNAGADVNALDRWGNSPLWRAVYHAPGSAAIIELLLEHGADPTVKNHHDVDALDLARRLAEDHDDIADMLPKLEAAAERPET